MPSDTPIGILQGRLARGEITLDEFHKLSPHVQGMKPSPGTPQPSQHSSAALEALANTLPDGDLIEVAGLRVGGAFFSSEGKRHAIDDITSLKFQSDRVAINFISTTKTFLTITLQSGAKYKHWTTAMLISGKGNALLSRAYQVLAKRTFAQRLGLHVGRLRSMGITEIGDVKISKDGWISKGGTRINIAAAWRDKNVIFGTGWEFGFNGEKNPFEIIVGENGTTLLARRVRVVAYEDMDILKHFINHFRNN